MAIRVLEVDEERIPKEHPPELLPIPPGKEGDIIVEALPKMTHFAIFGRKKVLHPRSISLMSRIESLRLVDNILGSGQREERKLLPLGSDHPEEVVRYWNYARLAKGKVLVYRLGLGLFARMAVHAKEVTVIEPDAGIRKLVWAPTMSNANVGALIPGDVTVFSRVVNRYDFVFIDPVPYTGKSTSMMVVDRLPELNRLITVARKLVVSGGGIAVRGYKDLVSCYQQRCQSMVGEVVACTMRQDEPNLSMMDNLFYTWALRNKRRVLEKVDYKFINAWARNTALTVI